MRAVKKRIATAIWLLVCIFTMSACDSFYELFTEEDSGDDGVYYVIYDDTNTEEEIAAIPNVHLMAGDLRNDIKKYGLTYEVTLTFDTETENEASLTCFYYHNRNEQSASDYCCIGMTYLGTYTMEGDKITFKIESEGFNIAVYNVGADYAQLGQFRQFSYAEDKSNGVWAYENTTYDYSEAEINEAILTDVPGTVVFTVSGNKIVSWEAVE